MLNSYDNIKEVDIELTNVCNLNCVLCARNIKEFSGAIIPFQRPSDEWMH